MLKATENSDMIGLGINHVLSKTHLDFKTELAETIHNVELSETQASVYVKLILLISYYS